MEKEYKKDMKYNSLIHKTTKIVMILILLGCILGIGGCSSEEFGVSVSTIREDIEKIPGYSAMMVETESVEIIKRQTNADMKEDLVYVTVKGRNEHYEVVRNYKLLYLRYNDGWILEEIKEYSDDQHWEITTPLQEQITEEDIQTLLDAWDLTEFTSFKYDFSPSNIKNITCTGIEKVSTELRENYGKAVYMCDISYEFYCFTERIRVPVSCDFSTYDGSWSYFFENDGIEREVILNNGILGTWQGGTFWVPDAEIEISAFNETSCWASLRFQRRNKEPYYCSGKMQLKFRYQPDNNTEYRHVQLVWEEMQEEVGSVSSPLLLTGYGDRAEDGRNLFSMDISNFFSNDWCVLTKVP